MKKILTFALRVCSICLVLSAQAYLCKTFDFDNNNPRIPWNQHGRGCKQGGKPQGGLHRGTMDPWLNQTCRPLESPNKRNRMNLNCKIRRHCRRNDSNLFQITADAHPVVSGVSKDQKLCEKFKNTHCQVDHPAKLSKIKNH